MFGLLKYITEEAVPLRKTVNINGSECLVETLWEWLESRIRQLRTAEGMGYHPSLSERRVELEIIRDKLKDGRIVEIGKESDMVDFGSMCDLHVCQREAKKIVRVGDWDYWVCQNHADDMSEVQALHDQELRMSQRNGW